MGLVLDTLGIGSTLWRVITMVDWLPRVDFAPRRLDFTDSFFG
ncbi:MAG: hypothetical protein ACFCA4_10625 [Cyanophyceae cyanobacterium]